MHVTRHRGMRGFPEVTVVVRKDVVSHYHCRPQRCYVHVLLFSRGLKPRTPCPVIWVCVIKSLGWNMGQYRAPLLVKYNNMPMAEYKFKYS